MNDDPDEVPYYGITGGVRYLLDMISINIRRLNRDLTPEEYGELAHEAGRSIPVFRNSPLFAKLTEGLPYVAG